ncbi:SIMPL domain-containing protein [Candidatus Pacearchaeota archaeon]|nr:SIMPL domain-containing protein [Candidatus Pacearchaeota archaeon]
MDKSIQITLIIVSAFVLITLIGVFTFYPLIQTTNTNTIRGNGYATVDVLPDLVTINFQVETKGDTLQEARDKNTEIVDKLITNLLKQGFERKEIQTTYYDIRENYVWTEEERKQEGYIAQHSIKVELSTEDTNKIGNVVDAGIDANASLSYINFELSTELQNQYKAEAIKLAAQDAKIKAEALAEGLDKELGKLVSVSDSNFNYSPWIAYDTRATAESGAISSAKIQSEIQPSEQEISASVTAIFKIK